MEILNVRHFFKIADFIICVAYIDFYCLKTRYHYSLYYKQPIKAFVAYMK